MDDIHPLYAIRAVYSRRFPPLSSSANIPGPYFRGSSFHNVGGTVLVARGNDASNFYIFSSCAARHGFPGEPFRSSVLDDARQCSAPTRTLSLPAGKMLGSLTLPSTLRPSLVCSLREFDHQTWPRQVEGTRLTRLITRDNTGCALTPGKYRKFFNWHSVLRTSVSILPQSEIDC